MFTPFERDGWKKYEVVGDDGRWSDNRAKGLQLRRLAPGAMQADFLSFADAFGEEESQSNSQQQQGSKRAVQAGSSSNSKQNKPGRSSSERNSKRKAAPPDSGTPWTDAVNWNPRRKSAIEQLQAEMEAFYDCVRPRPEEHRLREKVVNSIKTVVSEKFRDATVHPFGSFTTQLYLPSGDIDLVVMVPSLVDRPVKTPLYTIASKLKQAGILTDITVIAKARVPIIKGKSILGGFNIDISLNQHSGLKAAPLVNSLIKSVSTKASTCLIMIVKAFLAQRGLHEVFSGGLGSYSVICLVISFLQLHPEIQMGNIDPAQNLGVLLIEFLELYGNHFNYDIAGVSVLGRGGYFDKVERGWMQERQTFLLSIEDPQDPENDISKGSRNILDVRRNFWGAHEMLTTAIYERQELLEERYPDEDLCSRSLLGCIISLPDEVRNARERNLGLIEKLKLSKEPSPPSNKRLKREDSLPPPPSPQPSSAPSEVNEDSFNHSSFSHLPAYALEDDEVPVDPRVAQEKPAADSSLSSAVNKEPEASTSRGMKRESSPDLSALRPGQGDDEESRYGILKTSPKKRKVTVINVSSSSEDSSEQSTESSSEEDDSDSENEVAKDLVLNTGRKRPTESRPTPPRRTSNKAARQAYWAAKGARTES